ncbi:DUF3927 family protein [Erwiniaceae bacterium L1_54_3]|nr:DUF3927 family protein [Erwiniaceae bacterium L1_54_3]
MIDKLRYAGVAILLFLVIAVDFTSRILSMVSDAVFVIGVVVLMWPVITKKE